MQLRKRDHTTTLLFIIDFWAFDFAAAVLSRRLLFDPLLLSVHVILDVVEEPALVKLLQALGACFGH